MYNLFKCPKCGQARSLSSCSCNYPIEYKNNVYQLTDAPYIVKDDSADVRYIGYEDIGEYFSGKSLFDKMNIDVKYKKTAEIIGDGILLDLACGDGFFTIPLAMQNISVISMDISDKMLNLLYKRAEIAELDFSCLTVCRANALDIPLMDCSVDAVIANSMLHLISMPELVVKEIHRVLKKGGKFITFEDNPGKGENREGDLTEEEKSNNKKANEFSEFIYGRYFNIIKDEYNISPKRYSWKFDREKVCGDIFNDKIISTVENKKEKNQNILKDTFFHRIRGKGFSDQSDIPNDVHTSVFDRVTSEFISTYGEEALNIAWTFPEGNEIMDIILYIK